MRYTILRRLKSIMTMSFCVLVFEWNEVQIKHMDDWNELHNMNMSIWWSGLLVTVSTKGEDLTLHAPKSMIAKKVKILNPWKNINKHCITIATYETNMIYVKINCNNIRWTYDLNRV